jgi:hypothetical protein
MEEGVLLQAKELPLLQEVLKSGMDFYHSHSDVPDYLTHVMNQGGQGGQGGQPLERQLKSAALALCRAMLLISKPSALREAGEAGVESNVPMAILSEARHSITEH